MKEKFLKILKWLDDNILLCLAIFLLAFIPLMPKIPVADLIPGYIVRMRYEDIVIAITFIIYVIWGFRGKINWKFPLWKWILAYLILGGATVLYSIFILGTTPPEFIHISKTVLHWARYAQYFFLAFLLFS
ncbi:MAG: hypothetical protein LBG64_00955, partial [Pseudomonadales bacterium]|nr:hypothetical protein [Pseudomonadales bacterium]